MSREFDVAVVGGVVHVWQDGSGPPVVLLHGGPGLSEYLGSLLPELDGYSVTRFQQRGLAPSTTEGPFSVEQHVADTIAVIDAIGAERAWVVGHSWGGHLVLHLAAAHPERLHGIVSVDPLGAVPDGGAEEMNAALVARMTPERAKAAGDLDARSAAGEAISFAERFRLVWPGYFSVPADAPPMPELRLSAAGSEGTWESITEHFACHTLESRLPATEVPCVFVVGADSPLPPAASEASAALMPRASVRTVEDAGHLPWLERPGSVAGALTSLREVG
jgi:pimeloyl-ACP methyl ester carboxylesterase